MPTICTNRGLVELAKTPWMGVAALRNNKPLDARWYYGKLAADAGLAFHFYYEYTTHMHHGKVRTSRIANNHFIVIHT